MSKENKYQQLIDNLMNYVGGKDNISFFTHCVTRLRFNFKDKSLVKEEEIGKLSGVIGTKWAGNQFQIIIGASVDAVYNDICDKYSLTKEESLKENLDEDKKEGSKKPFISLFEVLSACIAPMVPAMCGSGIIKGILIALTSYNVIDTSTGAYIVLNAVADSAFYFFPFLAAYGASKKFKVNTILALVVAGLYIHPTITALAKTDISIFGLPVHILNYSSTIFPAIISVWVMSYVYKFIDKFTPEVLKIIIVPTLTFIIMAILSLAIIGPLGYYVGLYLAKVINYLFDNVPVLAGAILGAIRPVVILTGMQTVFSPIIMNNYAVMGYDVISPVHTAATMAAAGVCLGAFLKAKDKEEKNSYFSFFISAFIGITEPALYGLVFRFKNM